MDDPENSLINTDFGNGGENKSSPSNTGHFRTSSCLARGGEEPSLNEAVTMFDKRDKNRIESPHYTQRYYSSQYNALKGTQREVLPESLNMGRIGHNGLNRYDVQPDSVKPNQHKISEYYMAELQRKKGTTDYQEGPLFIVKGLHNYSNLPPGDARVFRASTTTHEQYTHPLDRAEIPAKYSHLQAGENTDNDGQIGPISGCPEDTFRPTAIEAEKRMRYYRDAITRVSPASALDKMEELMREKLDQHASANGLRGYRLRNCFRFFDRDAKGIIDLTSFSKALDQVGLVMEKHMCVALFARYDRQRRGFIDYNEFINHLIEKVFFTQNEAKQIASKIEVLRLYLKENGTLKDLDPLPQDPTPQSELSDDEFMNRQRLRTVYYGLDRGHVGSLNPNEFSCMLRLVGAICDPVAVTKIFDYVNTSGSGLISFEEFLALCSLTVPENNDQAYPEDENN
jgi:Ca2+-binding EF-hand superfamily protein